MFHKSFTVLVNSRNSVSCSSLEIFNIKIQSTRFRSSLEISQIRFGQKTPVFNFCQSNQSCSISWKFFQRSTHRNCDDAQRNDWHGSTTWFIFHLPHGVNFLLLLETSRKFTKISKRWNFGDVRDWYYFTWSRHFMGPFFIRLTKHDEMRILIDWIVKRENWLSKRTNFSPDWRLSIERVLIWYVFFSS